MFSVSSSKFSLRDAFGRSLESKVHPAKKRRDTENVLFAVHDSC